MTEKDIAAIVGKDRVIAGHPIVCSNVNHLLRGQQDVLSVNGKGMLIEYEIKISRSDFKRDEKKNKGFSFTDPVMLKNQHNLTRIPNQFYYVVPDGLVKLEEIPDWAGLMYVVGDKLILQKKAPVIHTKKHDQAKILKKVTTLYQQRHYLGCCLLTYNNKK